MREFEVRKGLIEEYERFHFFPVLGTFVTLTIMSMGPMWSIVTDDGVVHVLSGWHMYGYNADLEYCYHLFFPYALTGVFLSITSFCNTYTFFRVENRLAQAKALGYCLILLGISFLWVEYLIHYVIADQFATGHGEYGVSVYGFIFAATMIGFTLVAVIYGEQKAIARGKARKQLKKDRIIRWRKRLQQIEYAKKHYLDDDDDDYDDIDNDEEDMEWQGAYRHLFH